MPPDAAVRTPHRCRCRRRCLPRRQLPTRGTRILSVSHATKRFGGLVAVNDVSFDVDAGEIVGLIGPNGAGKTTMFNLLTCTLPMTSGSATFLGHDIGRATQRAVARLGLARTFQHVKLRPQMSLLDNVALGAHARTRAGVLQAGLRLDRAEERAILAEAWRQLDRIGLAERAGDLAGSLPLGTQRILEIARALAADPVLLVLDEPAAGLRRREKQAPRRAAAAPAGRGGHDPDRRARHGLRDEAGRPAGRDELRAEAGGGGTGRGAGG